MESTNGLFTDMIDGACLFTDQFELKHNQPDKDFLQQRMEYLAEEFTELQTAINTDDDPEIVDGAIDVAFIAVTQAYLAFRRAGFPRATAVAKVRAAFYKVVNTNLKKEQPTKAGEKIRKPDGWEKPDMTMLFTGAEPYITQKVAAQNKEAAKAVIPADAHAPESKRAQVLDTAKSLTCGDRNSSYGDPHDNMAHTAGLWNAYLGREIITARDVANMMVLLKLARAKQGALGHWDNYVDAAAYAGIAAECEKRQIGEMADALP